MDAISTQTASHFEHTRIRLRNFQRGGYTQCGLTAVRQQTSSRRI